MRVRIPAKNPHIANLCPVPAALFHSVRVIVFVNFMITFLLIWISWIRCYQSSEKLFVELFKMPPKAKRLTRKEAAVLRDKERVEEEWRKIKRTEEMLKVLDLPEFPK